MSAEHQCSLPNSLGRIMGMRAQCQSCRRRWVLQHAINPDGRTSIRGEWVLVEGDWEKIADERCDAREGEQFPGRRCHTVTS